MKTKIGMSSKYFKDPNIIERKNTVPLIKQMVRFFGKDGNDEYGERIIIRNFDELDTYVRLRQNKVLYNGLEPILQGVVEGRDYNADELMNFEESPELRTIKLFHRDNDLLTATQKTILAPIFPMMAQISNGRTVIVNEEGGWSFLDEGFAEIASDEIAEVLGAKITWGDPRYLVIENSASISKELTKILTDNNIASWTEICYLKAISRRQLSDIVIKLADEGLKEIILETTFQDTAQAQGISQLIEHLPNLTIRILTSLDYSPKSKHKIIKYSY